MTYTVLGQAVTLRALVSNQLGSLVLSKDLGAGAEENVH